MKITSREAAEMIGVRPDTLRIWRYLRKGPPYYRMGRAIRYERAEIEAWMRKRKVKR